MDTIINKKYPLALITKILFLLVFLFAISASSGYFLYQYRNVETRDNDYLVQPNPVENQIDSSLNNKTETTMRDTVINSAGYNSQDSDSYLLEYIVYKLSYHAGLEELQGYENYKTSNNLITNNNLEGILNLKKLSQTAAESCQTAYKINKFSTKFKSILKKNGITIDLCTSSDDSSNIQSLKLFENIMTEAKEELNTISESESRNNKLAHLLNDGPPFSSIYSLAKFDGVRDLFENKKTVQIGRGTNSPEIFTRYKQLVSKSEAEIETIGNSLLFEKLFVEFYNLSLKYDNISIKSHDDYLVTPNSLQEDNIILSHLLASHIRWIPFWLLIS